MTTAKTPWTTEHNTATGGATIKDANGNVIGAFLDWRNAEMCRSAVVDAPKEIERLNEQVENLEEELSDIRENVKNLVD